MLLYIGVAGSGFKTCKVRNKYNIQPIPGLPDVYVYIWWKRTNVSNIVWCLENYIDPVVHKKVFPKIRTPVDVEEKATEPRDWSRIDIRLTLRRRRLRAPCPP